MASVLTWYSAQKNMLRAFIANLRLQRPVDALTVRQSRGYECQAAIVLLLPRNLVRQIYSPVDIDGTNS